jgi:uncharacterized membrane protein YhaH (DUF805 family)
MSEATTMDAANPYNAPDAELGHGGDDTYTPSIISFNGRIGRLRYLAYGMGTYILMMLVMIPLAGTSAILGGGESMSAIGMLLMAVVYIAMLVAGIAFAKRRLNDLNRSGWWFLLVFVPIANLLLTIYLIFFPGTDGSNNWGPAPGPNSIGVLILGWSMPVLMVLGIVAAIAVPQLAGVQAQ